MAPAREDQARLAALRPCFYPNSRVYPNPKSTLNTMHAAKHIIIAKSVIEPSCELYEPTSLSSFFALSPSFSAAISSLVMLYEADTWLNGLSGCFSNSLRI